MVQVHSYTSKEPLLKVNAFVIESGKELVIVDTTLTMSDSKQLHQLALGLNKPIAAILLTHGHPDHVAGTSNIVTDREIPIYALESVKKLMESTEQMKHQQWSEMFGEEWIPRWVYPNRMVTDGEIVQIGELTFKVIDLGSGGDCDANSIWLLENLEVAFVGDFLYSNNHTYMADGSILRWLANLQRWESLLKQYNTYYVGHGPACSFPAIQQQKEYFMEYCAAILHATNGTGLFTEESKKTFETTMFSLYPDYDCQFMVSLAADKVGSELISLSAG